MHCNKRRLIPTHAGKTRRATKRAARSRAHPHSRGENEGHVARPRRELGSSPLTRGKRAHDHRLSSSVRLIPTHAGKTWVSRPLTRRSPAHPHSRGENRGCVPDLAPGDGLIPTHAGKTECLLIYSPSNGAHPHSRGENSAACMASADAGGSSPLTRGKPTISTTLRPANGLIPTHAGKTHARASSTTSRRAHPHSRGENSISTMPSLPISGSSPLTRGKLAPYSDAIRDARLIPTHAGKTAKNCFCNCSSMAHPHSRGENGATHGPQGGGLGSSPLTRGKLA